MDASQPFYPSSGRHAYPPRHGQTGCEFIEQYSQSAHYANHVPQQQMANVQPQIQALRSSVREMAIPQPMQPRPQSMFGSTLNIAPVLPPIRSNSHRSSLKLPPLESTAAPSHYRSQEPQPKVEARLKEEKTTGGVSAHLDYDMDQMTDFVADMAQGMYALYDTKLNLSDIDFVRSVHPRTPAPPQFRKYVSQILSSTRLPSSTILLGLYYLASRMRICSQSKNYESGPGQVYRMLTTALILGSKFLDDNTFQNRSWSEVSSIPVAELNKMELQWLDDFGWCLHERAYSQHDGFAVWKAHWEKYRHEKQMAARVPEPVCKPAPIDTRYARRQNNNKHLLMSPDPIPSQYRTYPTEAWLHPMQQEYSPPSAPHSGANTPDYYGWSTYAQPPPPYSHRWGMPQQPPYIPPRSQPPSYHHTPLYSQPYQTFATGHGASCGCAYCVKYHDHHFAGYGIQSVAG